jgi:NADP-dependent 3-hydroxy acid dehydrogenase YdfG
MTPKRVIIVTGASRGLGAAIACWLGKAGASVTLMARSGEKLRRIAKEINRLGSESLICMADVSDPKACNNIEPLHPGAGSRRTFHNVACVQTGRGGHRNAGLYPLISLYPRSGLPAEPPDSSIRYRLLNAFRPID